jgi:hypothetical protein
MEIQFQEHDAEKALLTITQKGSESITEHYHRISALWNLAKTPEKQRIREFVTSIRLGISMTLLDREFPSVARALESARIVEERRKDVDTNYPHASPLKIKPLVSQHQQRVPAGPLIISRINLQHEGPHYKGNPESLRLPWKE